MPYLPPEPAGLQGYEIVRERGLPVFRVQQGGREEWLHTADDVDKYRQDQEAALDPEKRTLMQGKRPVAGRVAKLGEAVPQN